MEKRALRTGLRLGRPPQCSRTVFSVSPETTAPVDDEEKTHACRGASFRLAVASQKDPKMSESITKVCRRKAVAITVATDNVFTMQECATKVQWAAGLSISGSPAELGAVFHVNSLAVVGVQGAGKRRASRHTGKQQHMVTSAVTASGNREGRERRRSCECWVALFLKPNSRDVRVLLRRPECLLKSLEIVALHHQPAFAGLLAWHHVSEDEWSNLFAGW